MLPQGSIDIEDFRGVMEAWVAEMQTTSLEQPLMSLGPLVRKDFDDHFIKAMGPSGGWPPRKYHYPWPILIKTGLLKESATTEGVSGNISKFSEGWAQFGVDGSVVNYASFHEYGTSLLPPRPWAWLAADAQDEAADQLLASLFALFVGN